VMANTSGNVWTASGITTAGTYYIIAYDVNANRSVSLGIAIGSIDTAVPVIANIEVDPTGWSVTNKIISAEVTDAGGSGLDRVFYATSTGASSGTDMIKDGASDVWSTPAITVTGTYYIVAYDKAGNRSESGIVNVNQIDLNPPVITDAVQNQSGWAKSKTISAQASDSQTGDSGIDRVFYSADSAALTGTALTNSGGVWTSPAIETQGTNTYYIIAYDIAGNRSSVSVTVDKIEKTAPENLKITYTPRPSLLDKIISGITFGFYNKATKVTITLSAEDVTTPGIPNTISGVEYFTWSYMKTDGVSSVNEASKLNNKLDINPSLTIGNVYAASFTLPLAELEQYHGSIKFTATDKAGNTSGEKDDTPNNVVVVDTISPTRVVEYSEPKKIVDASTLLDRTVGDLNTENSNSILYYDGDATIKFKVNEANFYAEDILIEVKKEDGAFVPVPPEDWSQAAGTDDWTGTITLSGDGDYWVNMTYTDRSENEMSEYTSQKIVIDTIDPVISVNYSPNNLIRELSGRKYFNAVQTATIVITERNFRADDVAATIAAKDITGSDVSAALVNQLTSHLSNRSNWTKTGDVYKASITYSADANYTFDIEYDDLVLRSIAQYTTDVFTVDTMPAKNLSVTYSTNVFETVLETITFGFYDAQMTVTISAQDDTAGIFNFVYGYIKSEGVSNVNAELLKERIETAGINYTNNDKTATTSFTIPKSALAGENQFRGTVEFNANDRSDNNTDLKDARTIVVDNITPTATVSYSEHIKEANGVFYHNKAIDAAISVKEANFYSQDVSVVVTRDGSSIPADVKWNPDNSDTADDHTGKFTLTGDGDYIVTINYADRSTNKMTEYKSSQLTVDTKKPEISVKGLVKDKDGNAAEKGIGHKTAHNDDVIGFIVTAKDTNFDLDSSKFAPKLTALYNGKTERESVSIGTAKQIAAGKEYYYEIPNLTDDAIYFLECTVIDYSGNSNNEFTIIDSDGAIRTDMWFSVNRDGSTFLPDDSVLNIVKDYFTQGVYSDIVIKEINVDSLTAKEVKLNSTTLEANKDYTVIDSKEGSDTEWHEYTYTVKNSLFKSGDSFKEGEYKVVISSADTAGSNAFSDIKTEEIKFVIDTTMPDLSAIVGLKDNGRYQVETQTVTVTPKDDGGKLNTLKAVITDSSGKEVKTYDWNARDFAEALEKGNGQVSFDIPSGMGQNVQIICNDYAVNEKRDTNTFDKTYKNVTVSTNLLVIFYANKPLFFGSIGGILLLSCALWFFLSQNKKKKSGSNTK